MGAIKTMKEVESALPQKKEINYVRALDKEGNPILIHKSTWENCSMVEPSNRSDLTSKMLTNIQRQEHTL